MVVVVMVLVAHLSMNSLLDAGFPCLSSTGEWSLIVTLLVVLLSRHHFPPNDSDAADAAAAVCVRCARCVRWVCVSQ